jgi:hypothetical protein
MRECGVDGGRDALVYSVVEDTKEEDGISTRSSVKIDGSKGARTMLVMRFTVRVGKPLIRSETRILVYAEQEQVRREYADAVVGREPSKGRWSASKRHGGRDAHGGLVGDWDREKHTKLAQEDYLRRRTTHLKYAHFAPPPAVSAVYNEGLLQDKLQVKSAGCGFTKRKGRIQ